MGSSPVLKGIKSFSTGGLIDVPDAVGAGNTKGAVTDILTGGGEGATNITHALGGSPLDGAPTAVPESAEQQAADAAAAAAEKKSSDLLASQQSEAQGLGTTLDVVQSGAGRTGHGYDSTITAPLGLDADDGPPPKKRLLGF